MSSHLIKIRNHSIIAFVFLLPFFAQGASYENPLCPGGTCIDNIPDFLAILAEMAFFILTSIIVLYVIYAGYLMVTANGDEGQVTKARSAFMYAMIGAILIIGARIFAEAIQDTICELTPLC